MRSRVAMATAVATALIMVLVTAGTAGAATTDSAMVVRDSMDVGLAGTVGVVAVLVGAVGLVFGFMRRHRQALARRAAEERAGTGGM